MPKPGKKREDKNDDNEPVCLAIITILPAQQASKAKRIKKEPPGEVQPILPGGLHMHST